VATLNEIYLDNAATTKPYAQVCDTVREVSLAFYANPSSLHNLGRAAENIIKDARNTLARSIGAAADEIYFVSGGTEALNTALFGVAKASRKKHIVTCKTEHPACLEPVRELEKRGYEVSYIGVDSDGFVNEDELSGAVRGDTALVSLMQVNNEVGAALNMSRIYNIIKSKNKDAVFICDGVAGFLKVKTNVKYCDIYICSGHKIHAPRGVGGLYIKKGVRVAPRIYGGSQEKGLRSGTENTPAIAGFAKALELYNADGIAELREYMWDEISRNIPDVFINNADFEKSAPHILNVSFIGVKSESLLHFLEERGVYVSSGSACSSNKPGRSHVLTAMGCDAERADSALRFSFCGSNTKAEIDTALTALSDSVARLRRIKSK